MIATYLSISGKKVKESFDVAIDGRPDKLLSTQWDEHIETLLPARVAALNFFDGEKIESLADPLQSREVFRSAIENLLGVGLLDKLNADLKTYLRKTEVEAIADLEHTELKIIESELGDLDAIAAPFDPLHQYVDAAIVAVRDGLMRSLVKDDFDQSRAHGVSVPVAVQLTHFLKGDEVAKECFFRVRAVGCPVAVGKQTQKGGVFVLIIVVPRLPRVGFLRKAG